MIKFNIKECSIVLQRCPEDADGSVWCAEQSLPQVSAGEVKSEALEFGAPSSVANVAVKKIEECDIEEVNVKEEPITEELQVE
ncbi:uncharacterized protein LOC108672320 [Hyalella azteca]|uniref:Uncharacterized protein LOC108672320 n=1 Tax=Hyalella azteca TaxID=294128 RepID=A0A8B7NP56_HYAAZ|nr:uncharacterized protein LOC108672320 [Hyalella azteca]